jgi:hypothetical protein
MHFTEWLLAMMSPFMRFWLKIATKFLTSRGWRCAGVATVFSTVYSCAYFFVTELIDAINELWALLPEFETTLSGGLATAKTNVVANFLAQVNYIFPLDFLITCCCLYCSLMVTCIVIALFLKAIDFIGDLPLT